MSENSAGLDTRLYACANDLANAADRLSQYRVALRDHQLSGEARTKLIELAETELMSLGLAVAQVVQS